MLDLSDHDDFAIMTITLITLITLIVMMMKTTMALILIRILGRTPHLIHPPAPAFSSIYTQHYSASQCIALPFNILLDIHFSSIFSQYCINIVILCCTPLQESTLELWLGVWVVLG